MSQYDLTQKIAPFFDIHLVIPLLEFIGPRKVKINFIAFMMF